MDQITGDRTRSKVDVVCNESIHDNLFQLYGAVDFQIKSNVNEVVSQLGESECKVYQRILMESKSKYQFDYLRQLHILDKIVDDKSWECVKVLECSEDKGVLRRLHDTRLLNWIYN
jgi:hypothetical protein